MTNDKMVQNPLIVYSYNVGNPSPPSSLPILSAPPQNAWNNTPGSAG